MATAILLGTAGWWWSGGHSNASARLTSGGQQSAQGLTPASGMSAERSGDGQGDLLPASLSDTEVPGTLTADALGNLVINRGVRDMFDYFLSASGEESIDRIRQRVQLRARRALPSRAALQLGELFEQYLRYKQAAGGTSRNNSTSQDISIAQLRDQVTSLQRLRAGIFTAQVIKAFFADEDAYMDFELAKSAVLQEPGLSPLARAQKIATLRDALPKALRDGISVAESVSTLNAVTADLKQSGGTPAQLRAVREQLVGAEAANRLDQLDDETQRWDLRVNSYLSQRQAILVDPSLSELQRDQALAGIRTGQFSEAEQVRIAALERIHDAGLKLPAQR